MVVKTLDAVRVVTPQGRKSHLQFGGRGNTFCGKEVLRPVGFEDVEACRLCERSAHVFVLHGWRLVIT